MAVLGVDKRMLQQLESMGFPTGRASRALYYSGNSSIQDAINWALEHEGDSGIDQIPQFQVPIDIQIESGEPLQAGEEVKMKLKDLREQVRNKREEEEKSMAREQEKAERRRKLGLSHENPGNVKPTPLSIHEENIIKNPIAVIPSVEEPLKDCLRSLKKNHMEDDAKVKKTFQTLLTYVANVVRSPDNEKYRKIRLCNPLFQDRVGNFKEAVEFLELCGFHKLESNDFLYMPRNKVEMKVLNSAGLALNSALTNPFFGILSV